MEGCAKMYETAVFDLDGILLENGFLTHEGKEAVNLLLQHGVHVIYSSGKNYWYTVGGLSFSHLLQEDTIVIAENGGIVFHPSTRKKDVINNAPSSIGEIARSFKQRYCSYEEGQLTYTPSGNRLWEEPKETIFTLFPTVVEDIPDIRRRIDGLIGDNDAKLYTVAHSDAIDTVPKGQDKGKALAYLERQGVLDLEKTMAFGDGENDKEMLSIVGMPVTVANAQPSVEDLVRSRNGIIANEECGRGVLEVVRSLI
jgi:HAD superfamily hydrolase (TIGR01484 family)